MEIKFYTIEEFDLLKEQWTLLENGPYMTPFQSYDWYGLLNEQYHKSLFQKIFGQVVYVVAQIAEKVVIIAPFFIMKKNIYMKGHGYKKGIYFFGIKGYSDYLDFIYDEYDERWADELIEAVSYKYKVSDVYLWQIKEGSPTQKHIENIYNIKEKSKEVCVMIELPKSVEEYKKMLSKNSHQNIRTAGNRIVNNGMKISYQNLQGVISIESAKLLRKLHEERYEVKNNIKAGSKGRLNLNDWYRRYCLQKYNIIINSMTRLDKSWLLLVYINNEIAAYYYGLQQNRGNILIMQAAINQEYSWYSPGVSTFYKYIIDSYMGIGEGYSFIDFTRGNEKYKYVLGGKERFIYNYYFNV